MDGGIEEMLDRVIPALVDLFEDFGYDVKSESLVEVFENAGLEIVSLEDFEDFQHA